jgi:hypothetical protein
MSGSIVDDLIEELEKEPKKAEKLFTFFSKVLLPWTSVKTNSFGLLERKSLQGVIVAQIEKTMPAYRVRINGGSVSGLNAFFHSINAEKEAMNALDERLIEMGFILI